MAFPVRNTFRGACLARASTGPAIAAMSANLPKGFCHWRLPALVSPRPSSSRTRGDEPELRGCCTITTAPLRPKELIQLVYASLAAMSLRPSELEEIAAQAAASNARAGITGLLLHQ